MNKKHYSDEYYRKAVRNFWIIIIAYIILLVVCYFTEL